MGHGSAPRDWEHRALGIVVRCPRLRSISRVKVTSWCSQEDCPDGILAAAKRNRVFGLGEIDRGTGSAVDVE